MSIRKEVWVQCDSCQETAFASRTARIARSEAKRNGWVRIDDKDLCWRCKPEPKK